MKSTRPLTVVIKLGTSSICDERTREPLLSNLSLIVETAVRLRKHGHKVVLVSSGAIGIGMRRLDIEKRPKHLATVQALAAVGQCRLIALWDVLFKQLRQPIAQILLTRNDIADRGRYRNATNTFSELLNMGVVPIVNENDTISVSEIKFGDNDTLSAITAGMVNADYLFLMTDVDCLYDSNPRTNPNAKPIEVVDDISSLQADVSSAGSALGTGGMATKLVAARLATSAGVTTIITRSSVPSNIVNIVNYLQALKGISQPASRDTSPKRAPSSPRSVHSPLGGPLVDDPIPVRSATPPAAATAAHARASGTSTPPLSAVPRSLLVNATPEELKAAVPLHTRFLPKLSPIRDKEFWLLHGLKPHGVIFIDEGAWKALTRANRGGLLPVGIVEVGGTFVQQDCVSLVPARKNSDSELGYDILGEEVGRAIVNYSSSEIKRIKGSQSSEIFSLLGYGDTEYVAHRNMLVMHGQIPPDSRDD